MFFFFFFNQGFSQMNTGEMRMREINKLKRAMKIQIVKLIEINFWFRDWGKANPEGIWQIQVSSWVGHFDYSVSGCRLLP